MSYEVSYLSIPECIMLYNELKPWAGNWLKRGGIDSPLQLASWARLETAFVIRGGHDYIVIVTDWYPGLKATIHPLFKDKRMIHNPGMMQSELRGIRETLGTPRIQVSIGSKAGNTVRRLSSRLGFRFEGTLRRANKLGDGSFEDLEVWSHIEGEL